jgi:hypothetical protein
VLAYCEKPVTASVMAKQVSCQPLTWMVKVPSQPSLCGICGGQSGTGTDFSLSTSLFLCFFFKEIYCTENSLRYTRLQNCSFNQFAIVVIRRARDRVSAVLGMYKCSSEKQVQREKHCGSWVNVYRRRCLGHLCMYFLYWRWRSAMV